MGKDHDLLEAARNGHISVVEKILNQKAKRTGPLASLRRGPGANIQDSSGYSGLHHAALNGHTDIVRLLLAHDASPNLPDTRGSSPLHLAAWAGRQEIVKLFLTAHRPANPNLQTIENETPLHCAAQHGHTGALTTLLAHGADPNVTNCRKETPLDLAAQYGRLQAVQMLIRAHPEMLLPYKADYSSHSSSSLTPSKNVLRHSPLHLASRNGHRNVVEVLLAAGVNVNLLTPSGTALHEAALCGKDSVVRMLLDSGADLDLTDCEGRTALDILEEFPPHVTKGIVSVINNHRNLLTYDSESEDHLHNKNCNNGTPMSLGSSYENNRGSPVNNYCNQQQRIFDTQISDITTSPSSSMGSLGPPSPKLPEFYISMAPIKQRLAAPKKPPRRNISVSPTHPQHLNNYPMSMSVDGYSNLNKSTPYEYICLAHTGQKKEAEKINRSCSIEQYVEMTAPRKPNNTNANTTLKSYDPNRKLKRNRDSYETFSIDFNKGRDTTTKVFSLTSPQSPTNYEQPPTPEHPPPSATQAEKFILERIRPLSQEYKRRSGLHQNIMIECGTSPQDALCSPSLRASNGSLSSSVSISDRSVSTDCVEEFVGDIPFAGLFKGSTMVLNNPYLSKSSAQADNYLTKHYNSHHDQEMSMIPIKDCKNNDHLQKPQQDLSEMEENVSSPIYGENFPLVGKSCGKNKRSLSFGGVLEDNVMIEYGYNIDDNHYKRCENGTSDITNRRSHIGVIDTSSQYDDEKKFRINRYFNKLRDTNSSTTINSENSVNNRKPGLGPTQRTNSEEVLSPFNEEEAWAKISEIMESFGSGILNSNDNIGQNKKDLSIVPLNRTQTKAGHKIRENCAEISELLAKNNLTHLGQVLNENGFDNIKYLNGILDGTDMIAMNISIDDRQKLQNVIQTLPIAECLPVLHNSNNNCLLNVDQWLHSIELTEYIDIFKKHLYTNMEGVCRIGEVELQTVLEINKIGHRKRILHSVSTNRRESITKIGTFGQTTNKDINTELIKNKDDYDINKKIELSSKESNRNNDGATGKTTTANGLTTTNVFRHSNKKNRPAPQPPIRVPNLEIRDPSELLLGLPSNLQTQWRHSANDLVNGSIKYEVFYLGSTIVKELRGTESTRKSIQKLKRDDRSSLSGTPTTLSSKIQQELQGHHQKQPVRLAISQRGVEFFDVAKNETICEHEIRNINCACQDADDLSHFAYLTKDATMNAHYCHVFNVDSMDLATEIILTLGQAFEVAYQIALRNASSPKIPIRCSVISTNASK